MEARSEACDVIRDRYPDVSSSLLHFGLPALMKVSHSRRIAWRLVLVPRAKALGSLGRKYLRR